MINLFFKSALLPDGWANKVRIEVADDGVISSVTPDLDPPDGRWDGAIAIPGLSNLHSHAFQRAMAGLGERMGRERLGSADDDFWSWRETMYSFVQQIGPDDLEAIAAELYVEMLEAGFTAVGEFHYLHHQPDGAPYDDPAEMSVRLIAAAHETGIGLTLLPVLYAQGDFTGASLNDRQARFFHSTDEFARLIERCRDLAALTPGMVVGVAPHSLRAVPPEFLPLAIAAAHGGPIHIHIAEQQREVDACLENYGARPVEWLFEHCDIDEQWCLVHATHMTQGETKRLARSGAIAGICPITEGNLGDGIFNGTDYLDEGGRWGVGSDSHIRIDAAEELRSFEYSQRLRDLKRVRLAAPDSSNGRCLFGQAAAGGARALGRKGGAIAKGMDCDIVSLDADHPLLIGKTGDEWLDSWIFAGDKQCVADVWVRGKHVVKEGVHISRGAVRQAFGSVMKHLASD